MNERVITMQQLRLHVVEAKREIEAVMDILGWPSDHALSHALDRLTELKELSQDDSTQ
jgi:hypothetical protein